MDSEALRIGFDAKRAFINRSGLGNYSRNILLSLEKYYPDNSYVLFTPNPLSTGIIFDSDDFEVVYPEKPGRKIYSAFWRHFKLAGLTRKAGIDLFHGLSNELPSGIRRTSVPSVVTIHDLIFLKFPRYYSPSDRWIYKSKVKHACHTADRIIAVSRNTKNDLTVLLGVSPDKIEVIYQPISARYYENPDMQVIGQVKRKYNLPERFVLSVGTIEERKNQINILKAVAEKRTGQPVVLVGRPTRYAEEIMKFVRKQNMAGQVRMITALPDSELPVIFKLAGMMAYISRYEGFGIPLIEAMASGCPVLASDTSCLPETAGGAALLCRPDDIHAIGEGISNIMENEVLRSELVSKGRERARDFDPRQTADHLISLYRKVISDGK